MDKKMKIDNYDIKDDSTYETTTVNTKINYPYQGFAIIEIAESLDININSKITK
jgi:hypothetical protein